MKKNKNFLIEGNLEKHLQLITSQQNEIILESIKLSKIIINKIKKKNKILICGNGGSASDAQHISTELTVRLAKNRRALPALALTTDTSALTAIGNDFEFNKIFSRQVEALGSKDDLLIAISTSGNSMNVVNALKVAKKNGLTTYGLLGNKGGKCKTHCKNSFIVESSNPSRVQEMHILFYHAFCQLVEDEFS